MNKMLHAVILVFFEPLVGSIADVENAHDGGTAAGNRRARFTRLCVGIGPFLTAGLAISALPIAFMCGRERGEPCQRGLAFSPHDVRRWFWS